MLEEENPHLMDGSSATAAVQGENPNGHCNGSEEIVDPRSLAKLCPRAPSIRRPTELHGRSEAVTTLLEAYESVKLSDKKKSRLIVVSGPTGSGKTELVTSTLGTAVQEDGGCFINWKFDSLSRLSIASGMYDAFAGLAYDLREQGVYDETRRRLEGLRVASKRTLSHIAPALKDMVGELPAQQDLEEFGQAYDAMDNLVGILSSRERPLVYFLDDVLFADPNSLWWQSSLIQNMKDKPMIWVATYNTDSAEEYENSGWKNSHERMLANPNVDATTIELEGLSESQIENLLSDMLQVPVPEVPAQLFDTVYAQTEGNVRFAVELALQMCQEGLLQRRADGWILDETEDRGHLMNIGTLTDLLAFRISRLPPEVVKLLKYASCLGTQLDREVLGTFAPTDLSHRLAVAFDGGILVERKGTGGELSFANNSMRAAACSLVPVEDLPLFHLKMGKLILKHYEGKGKVDEQMLTVVTLVGKGASEIESDEEKYTAARLCIKAAEKAAAMTSFQSASKSLDIAGRLVESRKCWRDDYEFALTFFNLRAEVAQAVGDHQVVEQCVHEVSRYARNFEDKVQAYSTLLSMLCSKGEAVKAIQKGLFVLKELGESFPDDIGDRVLRRDCRRTRKLLRGRSVASLALMRTMTDTTKVLAMQIMNIMFEPGFRYDQGLAVLLGNRMVRLSVLYGMSAISAYAFSLYGMTLCSFLGDIDGGTRYGELALTLLERFKTKEWIPRVHAGVGFVFPFSKHVSVVLPYTLRGYYVALETGDVEFAVLNSSLYGFYAFTSGMPLEELASERQRLFKEMEQSDQFPSHALQVRFSAILQDYEREEVSVPAMEAEGPDVNVEGLFVFVWYHSHKIAASFIHGQIQQALVHGEAARSVGRLPYNSADFDAVRMLFDGLAHVEAYRFGTASGRRHDRKHIKRVRGCIKVLAWLSRTATDFCLGKFHLLRAELLSLGKNKNKRFVEIVQLYKSAVALSCKGGLLMDEAVANELAGKYLMSVRGTSSGRPYLEEACALYQKWGARAKTKSLRAHLAKI